MNATMATRHVVITGASTGIGAACALQLAARGWRVFAGVRRIEDGERLVAKAGSAITPLLLDVTRGDQIAAAVESVRAVIGTGGLHGIVNNAGVAIAGPLEFMALDAIDRLFQVNVLGTIAVTQAFLPLLRAVRGRLVITGSNSGFWCEPFAAAYGASKFALEAIADSLRVELCPWGIEVALVEPGAIRTPIWEKSRAAAEELHAASPPECEALYGRPLAALRRLVETVPKLAIPPERVARAVQHALEARRPKTRYRVGPDARVQALLSGWIPDRLRDRINRWVMGL
jgi:NAD(P)-dependent dehydrogenase (short-subunit alcohol dehydrogenase family)